MFEERVHIARRVHIVVKPRRNLKSENIEAPPEFGFGIHIVRARPGPQQCEAPFENRFMKI